MRRLMSEKQLNADKYLATTLEPDVEVVSIMSEKRQKTQIYLDLAQVRFLKKESKRLNNASRGSIIRGIINMYMEADWAATNASVYNKDREAEGDLEFWMAQRLAP